MRLEEALDAPYDLTLSVMVRDGDADMALLLGRDAVLTIERLPLTRRVCGVVKTVREGQRRPDGSLEVHLTVVPALFMLSMRRNTRMFQNQSVPEILEAVLGESLGPYGRVAQLELNASYPKREYCLQYQESDLEFVSRLMQEEGIHYTFDHEGDVEIVNLRDDNAFAEPASAAPAPGEAGYQPHDLAVVTTEPIHRFFRAHDTTPTGVAVRDRDWTDGTLRVSAEEQGTDALGRSREQYEHGEGRSLTISSYDQGVRRYQANDAPRQASVRKQAHTAEALTTSGIGRVIGFTPGKRFRLRGHPGVGFDDDYLITHVVHESEESDELAPAGGAESYHNRFTCVPMTVPWRPRRVARKPRVPSIQTAIVTGPAGAEIHTDEWGRVKVHFHWDRENAQDDRSSVWMRVQQQWAGAGWGSLWIPRVGMEVVVQFVDGDPDRPLVTGSLYNAQNPPPYDLPAEKSKSTLKSNSTPGGGGFNELRFEDGAGSEQIYIHAQKDYDRVTLNNETHTVGVDQTIVVGNNQTQTVGNNQTETIVANQTLSVGGDRAITVTGNFEETIHGTSTIQVLSPATETLNAGETQTVNAGRTETVNGGETRTVNGGQTETINGGVTQTINGGLTQTVTGGTTLTHDGAMCEDVTGTLDQSITGTVNIFTPDSYNITANGGFNVTAPAGATLTAPAGWTVIAAAGQTQIDSSVDWLTGGFSFKAIDKTSIVGIKSSITGVSMSITGVSMDITGVKIANKPLDVDTALTKLQVGALELRQKALRVLVAALHLQI
ncbi:MAG: type VI secretion system Vgr family protein [Sandaracinaceae bacterium]